MTARLTLCILFAIAISPPLALSRDLEHAAPIPIDASSIRELRSTGTASSGLTKTFTESYWLYGAPGSGEGTFENASGSADWQGWTSDDLTAQPFYWQVSSLNAATLGNHGAGNLAAWCGQDATQQPGYLTAPGYGDNWDQQLIWESPPLVDPSIAQDVELEFFYHIHTEAGEDYFTVAYDSAGSDEPFATPGIRRVLHTSGTDYDWTAETYFAPGRIFSERATGAIRYGGNDYGEPGEDRIRLRLRFHSDAAWSNEDGLWPSHFGAVWIDDIRVRWDDGTGVIQEFFEDFEGIDPLENGGWKWRPSRFAGDFASILPGLDDLDPCVVNRSAVLNFIDRGQEISNAELVQYVPGTPTSTGGSTSFNWTYGLSGGWVVNYTDGVSGGAIPVSNAALSPPIAWDLAGTADDGIDVIGAILDFDVYEHSPLQNGVFWIWRVRSRSVGPGWSRWIQPRFVYLSESPAWSHGQWEIGDLLVPNPTEVQVALKYLDIAKFFSLTGNDATPAPYFDNVQLRKYRVPGPVITTERTLLAHDAFPASGLIDASTQGARDLLDVRFDMIEDRVGDTSNVIVRGDSLVIDVDPLIPGTTITDIRMLWVLDRNAFFDDVRSLPTRPGLDENVDANHGPEQWSGEVVASPSPAPNGFPDANRWFFDLPDLDFLYPGDTLRYAFRATDSDGRVTTLPHDITGLDSGEGYGLDYRVRGLPSIQDAAGTHNSVLVVDRTLLGDERNILERALGEIGWLEGREYDIYRSTIPTALQGTGIGAAGVHGASTAQLAGYTVIIFNAGNLPHPMGDGTTATDKSDDIVRMTEWHDLPGDRAMLHLGDHLIDNLSSSSAAGLVYIQNVLGVAAPSGATDFADRAATGDPLQLISDVAPLIVEDPVGIHSGCSPIDPEPLLFSNMTRDMRDWIPPTDIQPLGPAFTSHRIEGLSSGLVASAGIVIHDRDVLGDRKVDYTIHIPLTQMVEPVAKAASGQTARARLLGDLLSYFAALAPSIPVDAPPALEDRFSIAPNPFNPSTEIKLSLAQSGEVTVRAFDLRGRAVRTLHRGVLEAGIEHRLSWDGRDDRGERLASGVYFVTIDAPGYSKRQKVSLIK